MLFISYANLLFWKLWLGCRRLPVCLAGERNRGQLSVNWAKGHKMIVVTNFQLIMSYLALTANIWPIKRPDSLPIFYTIFVRKCFIWTIWCAHILFSLWPNHEHLYLYKNVFPWKYGAPHTYKQWVSFTNSCMYRGAGSRVQRPLFHSIVNVWPFTLFCIYWFIYNKHFKLKL